MSSPCDPFHTSDAGFANFLSARWIGELRISSRSSFAPVEEKFADTLFQPGVYIEQLERGFPLVVRVNMRRC